MTSLFGSPAYLRASAGHDGGEPAVMTSHGVRLAFVAEPDGRLHTPYGYPQPEGDGSPEALRAAAETALACERRWRIALAPLGRGAVFAAALAEHVAPVSSRPICVHDLASAPTERFDPTARSMVRRALRSGVRLDAGPVTPAFGALYRAAMDSLDAAQHYRFEDPYLLALNAAGALQLTLSDAHGLAAAALFLIVAPEATYHLSARRSDPPPPPGAANLLIAEGLERCRAAGAEHCYLGGGVTDAADDPLLRFKAGMATRVLDRPVFEHGGTA